MRTGPLLALFLLLGCPSSPPEPPPPPPASSPAAEPPPPTETGPSPAPTEATTPPASTTSPAPSAARKDDRKRWLGITVANLDQPIPNTPPEHRAQITRAIVGSPAAAAGLRRGDVMVEADGRKVLKFQDYLAEAREVEIGQTLPMVVLRDGKRVEATLTMIEKPTDVNQWRKQHFPGVEGFSYDIPNLRPEGTRSTSAAAKGKPQVLYFWATWCGPCRTTAPWIDQLHKDGGDKLQVVAVSSEELGKLKPYVARNKYSYAIAHDDEGTVKLDYEVNKLPTIALVDADNQVVAWDIGLSGVRRIINQARQLAGLPEGSP